MASLNSYASLYPCIYILVAEGLSARLLIVLCGQFTFVCMYIYMYLSHFNCVGVVSVVSSPDYEPRSTGLTARRSRRDHARAKMEQARATWCWSD